MTFNISFLSKLVLDIFLPLYSERSRHIKGSKNWNSDIYIHCKLWLTYAWYSVLTSKIRINVFRKVCLLLRTFKICSNFCIKNSKDFETIIVTSSKLHIFWNLEQCDDLKWFFGTHLFGSLAFDHSSFW